MTKKRFKKLTRAYFTELNEWCKKVGIKPMDMKTLYQWTNENTNPLEWCGQTRAEWWENFTKDQHINTGVKMK